MTFRTSGKLFALFLALTGFAVATLAADEDAAKHRGFSNLVNVDALVDNYLRVLARKYDLDEAQSEYTNQLVKSRVDDFLDRHHDDLGNIVDRLFEVRRGGEMSEDELMEWGRNAMPLYEEARALITDANKEWRGILNDKQKKIHDEDLRLMEESFATTEDQLTRIVAGEMTVDEFRNPRRSRRTTANRIGTPNTSQLTAPAESIAAGEQTAVSPSPRPVRPITARPPTTANNDSSAGSAKSSATAMAGHPTGPTARPGARSTMAGRPGRSPATSASANPDSFQSKWEAYVKQFCDKYNLNDDQRASADKILRSCEEQAGRYAARADRMGAAIDKQVEALRKSADPEKTKQITDLTERKKKLTEPIDRIFEGQLKPRLERLPTRTQRDEAENPKPKAPEPDK